MSTDRQANNKDLIRLRSMSSFWGDIFTGTKAQLNAIGFGVGCLFPGEPRANKRICKLPLAHGYAKVQVRVNWMLRNEVEMPFEQRTFEVIAQHLEHDPRFERKYTHIAPGVVLRGSSYYGEAQALIHAGIIHEQQLPGMPGCGKCTTTFDLEGNVFRRTSGYWQQPGFKVVSKYGKKISVFCVPTDEERATKKLHFFHQQEAFEKACMDAKRAKQKRENDPRPRPNLRLVWSA